MADASEESKITGPEEYRESKERDAEFSMSAGEGGNGSGREPTGSFGSPDLISWSPPLLARGQLRLSLFHGQDPPLWNSLKVPLDHFR